MSDKIETLAAALADAWRSTAAIPRASGADAPASRAEAYAIQDRMAALIGDPVAGWKVGATVPAVQRLEGHDGPIPGRIFGPRVFETPAYLSAAEFPGTKVECEFAFRCAEDLPRREQPWTTDALAPLVVFHPAVELTGTRWAPADTPPRTHEVIADNGSGAGFVFGPGITDWRALPFATLPIAAAISGGAPIDVYTGEYRRDPLEVLAETVNDLAARGETLKKGDYVSTGSLTVPTPLSAGQTLVARFAEIATIEVALI